MSEDMPGKEPVTATVNDASANRAVSPFLTSSPVMLGTPAPVPQTAARREGFRRWLPITLVGVLVLASMIGALISLLQRPAGTAPSSAFQSATCPFKLAAGVVEGKDVVCGYLTVPADHSRPQGPTIRLAVVIIKAPYPASATDPVIDLQGGPGTQLLAYLGPVLTSATLSNWQLGDRDLVLFDQRGVGYSQPSLGCQDNESVQTCHDRLMRQGINLNNYKTIQNAGDVHDLVRALGNHQVTLWGISYGTRLALTVMRLFPADIRSVVLDSTSPPQIDIDTSFPAATQRAFDTLFRGCAADPYCNQHYPHLQAVFARLVSDLNQHPATIEGTDPKTGKPARGVITGNDVVNGLRNALYDTALIPKLPKAVYQLAHHDYSQVEAISEAANAALGSDSVGMFLSVTCSEMALTPQDMPAAVQMVVPETRHYFLTSL